MPFQVVSPDTKSLIELWIDYTTERKLTPEILSPLKGELLPLDKAAKVLGSGLFGLRQYGAIGAFVYVYPNDPSHPEARVLYTAPPSDIPKVGETLKQKKPPKYYRIKGSANRIFVPPQILTSVNDIHSDPFTLYICEGALAATYLAFQGYRTIAVPGVENYRIGAKDSPLIPDLRRLLEAPQIARVVTLADSDVGSPDLNPNLYTANFKMQSEFVRLRANRRDTIYVCPMPAPSDLETKKYGPDDYLRLVGQAKFDLYIQQSSQQFTDTPALQAQGKIQTRFIWDEVMGEVFDTEHRHHIDKGHANLIFAQVGGRILDVTLNRPKLTPFTVEHFVMAPGTRVARGMVNRPDLDQVYIQVDDTWHINRHNPATTPKPIKGDVSIFYKVLDSLTRDTPSATQKILTILAQHVQFPATTPKYALHFTGDQGSGKSLFASLIGHTIGSYSSIKADLTKPFNSNWAPYLCREWAEFDKEMDPEWLKDLITSKQKEIKTKYGKEWVEDNFTLHIFTCNGLKAHIQTGDRRFVIAGFAKSDDKQLGLDFEAWVSSMGPSFLRYHLLNDVSAAGYDTLDPTTELKAAVIDASKGHKESILDMVLDEMSTMPNLDLLTGRHLAAILQPHNVNAVAFIKEVAHRIPPVPRAQIKMDGYPERFRIYKNHEYWLQDRPTEEYQAQFELAKKLTTNRKF